MADKEISLDEMMKLAGKGAKIRMAQQPSIIVKMDPSIKQVDSLLAKLDVLIKSNDSTVEAFTTLATALQTSIRTGDESAMDVEQMKAMVVEIIKANDKSTKSIQIAVATIAKAAALQAKAPPAQAAPAQASPAKREHTETEFVFNRDKRTGFVDSIITKTIKQSATKH